MTISTRPEDRYKYLLRLPPEIGVLLKARAKANRRSINAEACIIIQRAVQPSGPSMSLD